MRNLRPQSGFTIVELMVVIAIMGILMGLAAPAVQEFLAAGRMRSAASDLYSSFLLARTEAIKRNAQITLTPQGVDAGDADSKWKGWTVQQGTTVLEARDTVDDVGIMPMSNTAGTWSALAGNIIFLPSGRISTSASEISISIVSSKYSSFSARCVQLAVSGRPKMATDTNGNPRDGCN